MRRRVDLGWPGRGVGVEADGREVHDRPQAPYADRHRQNALLAARPGLVLLRLTWRDTLVPERFLAVLGQALAVGRPVGTGPGAAGVGGSVGAGRG